jgi:hypothetical protein
VVMKEGYDGVYNEVYDGGLCSVAMMGAIIDDYNGKLHVMNTNLIIHLSVPCVLLIDP